MKGRISYSIRMSWSILSAFISFFPLEWHKKATWGCTLCDNLAYLLVLKLLETNDGCPVRTKRTKHKQLKMYIWASQGLSNLLLRKGEYIESWHYGLHGCVLTIECWKCLFVNIMCMCLIKSPFCSQNL